MTDTAPFVRDDVARLLAMLAAIAAPPLSQLPLEHARAAFNAMNPLAEADPLALAVISDHACPGPGGEIPLRLYDARPERDPGPAILFLHGGGFVIGDLDSHHALCTAIAEATDLPVLAVHYRRAPQAPFPAAPDDAEAAARWLAASPAELGRTITGLIPMGDSAGGNLAIVTTQALTARPAAVPVVAQVPIYPLTHEAFTDSGSYRSFADGFFLDKDVMDWFSRCYAAESDSPRAYPLLSDHSQTPPTVLLTAGLDPLRDSGRLYAQALIAAGREVTYLDRPGVIHGFVNMRQALPPTAADMAAIFTALKAFLA